MFPSTFALAWHNLFDSATLSGGSWLESADYSLGHLKLRDQARLSRSANALSSSTQFVADFGRQVVIKVLGLAHTNLSRPATVRWDGGTEALGEWDTGNLSAWPMHFDAGLQSFERSTLWRNAAPAMAGHYRYPVWTVLADWTPVRYLRCRIVDTGNPAGAVYIGRPWASSAIVPRLGRSRGARYGWTDKSLVSAGPGGTRQVDERRRFRWAECNLDRLTPGEAEIVHEVFRAAGTTGEVVFLDDTASPGDCQRRGILGRLPTAGRITHAKVTTRPVQLRVEEL